MLKTVTYVVGFYSLFENIFKLFSGLLFLVSIFAYPSHPYSILFEKSKENNFLMNLTKYSLRFTVDVRHMILFCTLLGGIGIFFARKLIEGVKNNERHKIISWVFYQCLALSCQVLNYPTYCKIVRESHGTSIAIYFIQGYNGFGGMLIVLVAAYFLLTPNDDQTNAALIRRRSAVLNLKFPVMEAPPPKYEDVMRTQPANVIIA